MAVFLRDGESFVRMSEEPYELEDVLQKLVAEHPEILAGDEADGKRWVLVRRETGVPDHAEGSDRWSLDHLLVDAEGVLTLVEVKRSSDTRARREVVAQMLDYAANGSANWTAETVRGWFDAEHAEDAEAKLLELGRDDAEEFWAEVKTNLAAGRIRLVFVADAIAPELRSIVEFLNGQMRETEVLAIEVKQFVDAEGGRQTFVPRLIGQTEAARAAKQGGPRQTFRWNETTLLERIAEAAGEDAAQVAQQLIAWGKTHPSMRVDYGTGVRQGSASFKYRDDAGRVLLTVFSIWTDGRAYFPFIYMGPLFDSSAEKQEELRSQLEAALPGADLRSSATQPWFPLPLLASAEAFASFTEIAEWIAKETQNSGVA